MIVVVGGRASGKRTYIRGLGYEDGQMADGVVDDRPVLLNLQDAIAAAMRSRECDADNSGGNAVEGGFAPERFAASLADKQVVSCCEVGNGIVPIDAFERAWRENVGRTLNVLANQAESVVRMVCGIPVTL